MKFDYQVGVRINRPAEECFAAVYNPEILSRYFTSSSTGKLDSGKDVVWRWQGSCSGEAKVRVVETVDGKSIDCLWEDGGVFQDVRFRFDFTEEEGGTKVTLKETGWPDSQEGADQSLDCCSGWTDMLMSLKAYLLHGVDLRKNG